MAYTEHAMKNSSVFEWQKWFKDGQEYVYDDAKSWQSKSQTIDLKVYLERVKGFCLKEKP